MGFLSFLTVLSFEKEISKGKGKGDDMEVEGGSMDTVLLRFADVIVFCFVDFELKVDFVVVDNEVL